MSTLVNLVISFIMGLFFGHQMEEPRTASHEFQKCTLELVENLQQRQQILET